MPLAFSTVKLLCQCITSSLFVSHVVFEKDVAFEFGSIPVSTADISEAIYRAVPWHSGHR